MPLITVLLASGLADAADINVNPATCEALLEPCTLAEALDWPTLSPGDEIVYTGLADEYAGVINESVTIDGTAIPFSLVIRSASADPNTAVWTAIDGEPQISLVNGAQVTLAGFRLQGASASCITTSRGSLTLDAMEFIGCSNEDAGGAIQAVGTDLYISDTLFYGNSSDINGGAIVSAAIAVANDLELIDVEFSSNQAWGEESFGGAVAVFSVPDVVVRDSVFSGNFSNGAGGAISIEDGDTAEIWGNTFQQNKSLFTIIDEPVEEEDEEIGIIFSTGKGGAVYFDGATADVYNNLFCGNIADDGGAVYTLDVTTNTFTNNVFADNAAAHYGGGLNTMVDDERGGEPVIINNTFVGNQAGIHPSGGLVVIGSGGAIALDGTLGDIRNNIIAGSAVGGGIFGNSRPGTLFEVGDPIAIEYNLLFENCDGGSCESHFTSDLALYAVSDTNVQADPDLVYYRAEYDCYPDAFYPTAWSPVVDRGDETILDALPVDNRSDIGAYGGPGAILKDDDGDAYVHIYDCNDFDDSIHPFAADPCDHIDNNCDGVADEDFETHWWPDADGDGYGDADVIEFLADCDDQDGMATNNGDCDDTDPLINPGELEQCDSDLDLVDRKDDDCDGEVDEKDELNFVTYIRDADGDGFGDAADAGISACKLPDAGYVTVGGDCDDAAIAVNPNAVELCDNVDNNCDGLVDNDPVDLIAVWYLDEDEDGVGVGENGLVQCDAPTDAVYQNVGGDCDDTNPSVYPEVSLPTGEILQGASDVCDGVDNDCDGEIDNDQTQQTAWYVDADADGVGDNATAQFACDSPGATYVTKGGDCDDEDPEVGECEACGCQAVPTTGSTGFLAILGTLFFLRRRRD